MRLTSSFWVSAYIRRCNLEGAFAVVRRRGSPEAGAVFVVLDRLDGTSILFGGAPPSLTDEADRGDRRFILMEGPGDPLPIEDRLARELKFDSDLWIVAVEDRAGRHFLDMAEGR